MRVGKLFMKKWDHKNKSVKKIIIALFVTAWVVPVTALVISVFQYYKASTEDQINSLMQAELNMVAMNTAQLIDESIERSQQPSYDRDWEEAYLDYKKDHLSRGEYYNKINASLRSQFYLDNRFQMFAYYELDGEKPLCYGSGEGYPLNQFVEQFQEKVDEVRRLDTSSVQVRVIDGRLFLMRNLYTIRNYEKFGMLVLELKVDNLQQWTYPKSGNMAVIMFGDEKEYILLDAQKEEEQNAVEHLAKLYAPEEKNEIHEMTEEPYMGYLLNRKYEKYHMGVGVLVNRNDIFAPLHMMYRLIAIILLACIPVLFLVYRFLNWQISHPVERLVDACQVLESGRFEDVTSEAMPNLEFQYVMDSFCDMSRQLQYLFEHAYTEELARKDAKILALEAQINPHFLNNTLEIMKWKARIAGDMTVSEMIEKLGVLLNYRMDREGERLISLKEELKCADAYLYIISLRFGPRIEVERVIDESLTDTRVPRLILQPLLENAVVHGIERVAKGKVTIRIYQEKEFLYLQIINTGPKLSEEDLKYMNDILKEPRKETAGERHRHTSLGIRNVNERIKLIYGENFGLEIFRREDESTCASICLPRIFPERSEFQEKAVAKQRYQKAATEKYRSKE